MTKNLKFDLSGKRIWIAGHKGMVGSAIMRRLERENCDVVTIERSQLNLLDGPAIKQWLAQSNIDVVIVAAAKVGGIHANSTQPADFIYENLMIASNIIQAAWENKIAKLLFLGSSCIYPRMAPQPIPEGALLSGPLEPTNEWYAIAKIAGIKLCQAFRRQYGCDFISAMPTNLYGPNDNFHPENSHVPAALLQRFHEAKVSGAEAVEVWGSGKALREFLHVDDLADASVYLLENYSEEVHVNIGCGKEISIGNFAALIKRVVDYEGVIEYDTSRPDGTPLKKLDVSKLDGLGWRAQIPLDEGLKQYYSWFLENRDSLRV